MFLKEVSNESNRIEPLVRGRPGCCCLHNCSQRRTPESGRTLGGKVVRVDTNRFWEHPYRTGMYSGHNDYERVQGADPYCKCPRDRAGLFATAEGEMAEARGIDSSRVTDQDTPFHRSE